MYDDADACEIAALFRSVDARAPGAGLRNARALVRSYYSGREAAQWCAVLDALIAEGG